MKALLLVLALALVAGCESIPVTGAYSATNAPVTILPEPIP